MLRRREFLSTCAALLAGRALAGWAAEPAAAPRDLSALVASVRKRNRVPALAAAVLRGGQLVAVGADGVRKAGAATPVTTADAFHLGSCTKAMTATLAGSLVDAGLIAWDTTLAGSFPDLAASMHAGLRGATLEELLQHRTGMPSNESAAVAPLFELIESGQLTGSPRQQRRQYLAMILREEPEPPPRGYVYSNRGYIAAGVMLEEAADTGWEELIAQRLFEPLGMTTAGFGPMGTPGLLDQPLQHRVLDGRLVPVELGPLADNPPPLGPAGRVHCSLPDWAKFVQLHLDGANGKARLLEAGTYRRLHTPPARSDYAGGWIATRRTWGGGRPVLMHAGSNTMSYAVVWLAPSRDFAVLVATTPAASARACNEMATKAIEG